MSKPNQNVNKKEERQPRTRSDITKSLLSQAQQKSSKFERPPFDPTAEISHYEAERVTPRRNYRGVLEENPANYFDFPVPAWVKANQPPHPQPTLPKGIISTLVQCQQKSFTNASENALPPSFPDLQVVRANSREAIKHNETVEQPKKVEEYQFSVTKIGRDPTNTPPLKPQQQQQNQNADGLFLTQEQRNQLIAASFVSLSRLLFECEQRERLLIEEHALEIFISNLDHRKRELQKTSLGSLKQAKAQKQYDQALEIFIQNRFELMEGSAIGMCDILWEQFDLGNVDGLLFSLLNPAGGSEDANTRNKNGNVGERKLQKKDQTAELADMETRLAELETQLSWNKFERRRLEELLRKETAEAEAAKATRDATLQQLAALEAECVPLLQGMQEIFGVDGNNNSAFTISSGILGSVVADQQQQQQQQQGEGKTTAAAANSETPQKRVKTALERVADQLDQSPLHQRLKASGKNFNTPAQKGNSTATAAPLDSLDKETLASMILLERQLSQRMLIGAQSKIFAEVEAQKRFVDTNILMKKQAAHSMFLVDLFQHRLPQLRRACSALGSVVHKFENASATMNSFSTPGVPRHKSNVVSRHNNNNNVDALATNAAVSGGNVSLTHSALVAYSKSLVAHVASLLRWLDTEAG